LFNETFIYIITIFILLILSAFFAGIESSFFSLDWLKIKRLAKKGNKLAILIDKIRSKPKELVITFLIGNEIVNISISAITASFIIENFGEKYLFLGVLFSTILLLTCGEITPKTIGANFPEKYAFKTVRIFYLFYIIFTPFRFIIQKFVEKILKKFGVDIPTESKKISEEDIKSIIHLGVENKVFSEEELEIIESALELHQKTAVEIMTPRRDIFALEKNLTIEEALSELQDHDYSKIPVYEENLDKIVGILYIKDILPYIFDGKDKKIQDFIREAIFVPEFATLLDVIKSFEENKIKIAIVVDEHGTVVGLITFQDILEYIVGDIPEEFEVEEPSIEKIDENKWKVSGKIDIEILKEYINLQLPEDYDYDTLAGFILDQLKKFPEEGEKFRYQDFEFTILEMDINRIVTVLIEKKEETEID